MRAFLSNLWENARSSLWFLPSILVLAAFVLSSVLILIDEMIGQEVAEQLPMLFGGTADGARSLLSVIAGSLITVIAVAFSVTIVALQQASWEMTPRVWQTFMRNRANQVILGTYIATFTYSLLVMRQIREQNETQDGFIPSLSITAGILLALVSLGMLIYFIDHTARSLQVSWIVSSINSEMCGAIDRMFPSDFGEASQEPPLVEELLERLVPGSGESRTQIRANAQGYLRFVDEEQLFRATAKHVSLLWARPRVGTFQLHGDELAQVWSSRPLSEDQQDAIRQAFILSRQRSIDQDPLFGVRQLVDIAVKALSTSVNDPTTAEEALAQLSDLMGRLIEREFPSPLRTIDGRRYLFNRPSFADYVHAATAQVRRAASHADLHVTLHLLVMFEKLLDRAPNAGRAQALQCHLENLIESVQVNTLITADQRLFQDRVEAVRKKYQKAGSK